MSSIHARPSLSAPATSGRKGIEASGSVQSPKPQLVDNRQESASRRHLQEAAGDAAAVKRSALPSSPQAPASRSLSSGSSVSESASISSSSSTGSSMATAASSRVSDLDDEKSSGQAVLERAGQRGDASAFQLAGAAGSAVAAGHSASTRPTLATPTSSPRFEASSTSPRYHSQLPVASQQPGHRQAQTKLARHNSPATASCSRKTYSSGDCPRSRPAAGDNAACSSARAYSTSPRQGLSRSYTTSAVPYMGTGIQLVNASTSPPQFPPTSSVAPPVQNSASVTFAPAPTRARAYSTSASGIASPTSPAIESMAAINIDEMRRSPPTMALDAATLPSATLSSHQALVDATTCSPPSGTIWNSASPVGYDVKPATTGDPMSSASKSGAQVSPPLIPSNNISAMNRRHSVDPYSARNTSSNHNHNITTQQTPATGHRRHHQSISVPPSSSEYSSLGDQTHQPNQAHHLLHLGSRYRKTSLNSQALLSPKAVNKMSSPPGSYMSYMQNGSAGRQPQRERVTYDSGANDNGSQLSPTRSQTEPYLSTSPRYSSRASHEAQRNNQLEAKIVLLGRQGVGKTSLVHRYITGKFSSTLPMTIGASFLVKKLDFEGGIKVRLQIWDTAGQERFRSMAPMYYRGAHAAILVYDITNDESLSDIRVWLDELRQNMSSDLIVHIVGNKADLAHTSRKITLQDAQKQISEWIARPASGIDASTLFVPQVRGNATSSKSPDENSPSVAKPGMVGLASFNLNRSGSRQKASEDSEPALPAFKDWGLEEVSAKEDDGIDMLFATIAGKLVERKNQIEQERVLRTKDSIMITDEMKGKNDDPTRIWGCC